MKASVFRGVGQVEVVDVEIDEPGPREVLLRTAATGVCHSDLHFYSGTYPQQPPAILGHEAAGVVEAVGSQVRDVAPGDHVITCVSVFCGRCYHCLTGHPARCATTERVREADEPPRVHQDGEAVTQFAGLGTFAEKMLVHEHAVVAIRPDMPLDRAALIGCAVVTGLGAVFNTAAVEPGSTVAVFGCGGIGLNCVQGARLAGASRIIAVDRVASKLELARRLGATDAVDASDGDPAAKVVELTGEGADFAFEAVGLKRTAEQAFASLRPGGTATVIGMIPPEESVEVPAFGLLMEKRLQGSLMGSNRFRIDMPRYVDFYLSERLELDALVAERIGLEQLPEAFERLEGGESVRSVVVFD
jgi:S-(hydroxymethyl)glutathione dehydrogenase/alcohol dehydrogenase